MMNQFHFLNFQHFGWSGDSYTNWLTKNAVDIPLKIGSAVSGAGIGALAGAMATGMNPLGAAARCCFKFRQFIHVNDV